MYESDCRAAVQWFDNRPVGAPRTIRELAGVDLPVYLRVLHPAYRRTGEKWAEVSWAEVARANGRRIHKEVEWGSLIGSWELQEQPPIWDLAPGVGDLPDSVAFALMESFASTGAINGRVWTATWTGQSTDWSDLNGPICEFNATGRVMQAYTAEFDVTIPQRVSRVRDGINMLWCPDGRWCVSTDIDLNSTVVAATENVAAAVLASELEAFTVPGGQRLSWDTDTVNPLPEAPK